MSDIKKTFVIETKVKDTQKAKKALGELDTLMSPTRIRKGPDVLDRTMGKVSKKFDTILKQVKTLNTELQKTAKSLATAAGAGPTQLMQRPGVPAGGPASQPARRGMAMADVRRAGRISNMAGRGLVAGGLGGLGAAAGGALFLGGLVGGVLQTGQQAANLELSRQRAMLGVAANVNMVSGLQARTNARAGRFAPNQARIRAAALEANAAGLGQLLPDSPGLLRGTSTSGTAASGTEQETGSARAQAKSNLQKVIDDENAKARGRRRAAGDRAFQSAMGNDLDALMGSGFTRIEGRNRRISALNATERTQFMGAATGRSGGLSVLGAQGNRQFGQAALAAQTLFGIGPETSGGILAAERKGGLVGAEQGAGKLMLNVFSKAVAMGMDNSDVRHLMQSMADGQERFMETGLSMNDQAITEIARLLGPSGTSAGRRLRIGQALASSAQQTGMQGIQSDRDMLMLRFMGGYEGGGFDEYAAAMRRLVEQDFTKGEGPLAMFRAAIKGVGGGADGAGLALREMFPSLGRQAFTFADALTSGTLTEEASANMPTKGIKSGKELEALAADLLSKAGPSAGRQAGIEDRLTAAGAKGLLQAAQNMQDAAATQVSGLSKFGGALEDITARIVDLSVNMEMVAEHWANKAGS